MFSYCATITKRSLPEALKEGEMRNKDWGNKRQKWNHQRTNKGYTLERPVENTTGGPEPFLLTRNLSFINILCWSRNFTGRKQWHNATCTACQTSLCANTLILKISAGNIYFFLFLSFFFVKRKRIFKNNICILRLLKYSQQQQYLKLIGNGNGFGLSLMAQSTL